MLKIRETWIAQELNAEEWLSEYSNLSDKATLIDLARNLYLCRPVFKALRGIHDREEWLDAYSLIQWQTSYRRQALREPLYVTDAADLMDLLDVLLRVDQ